ncbi:MAG: NADH-quinone oxidoreductase subunit C [Bacteroidetes bacterium]|nr:MAG: NADH-quinone oxidoreductase subunit C [Bacteroidota bacterium]
MEKVNFIIETLNIRFDKGTLDMDNSSDMLTVTVGKSIIHEVIRFLKEDEMMGFTFLTTLCGIHFPDSPLPLGVIYHLHNLTENRRIRVKTFVPQESPHLPSITPLFAAANWMERETFDFYGIIFDGHPNLQRILNVEYLDYFPLRKEYPLEDPTREDKDDRFFGR